jgi:5-methylthioadenosine/S-adenosylhomocysteine deaminase
MSRLLIRNATVITMDPRFGVLQSADILIEGQRIGALGPNLAVSDAEAVDGRSFIVIPGIVNAHMHTWQTGLRGLSSNWTLLEYFRRFHAGFATRFRPEDIYIAELVGALNQLNGGTTTLVDWCHNNPTPAHTDAAVEALRQSGIRAAFFHGSPKPDPRPGEPHFSEVPHPRKEVERLLRGPFASQDQLLTLGLAILGPHYSTLDVSLHDFKLAREFGLVASMHVGGPSPKTPEGWDILEKEGLIGDFVNIVHGNSLTGDQVKRFLGWGVNFTVSPEVEMAAGHGRLVLGQVRKAGGSASLGVDLESMVSGDMLMVARVGLAQERAMDNADYRAATGGIPSTTVSVQDALASITLAGARMLHLEDRLGSIAPGKQADLVFIRADDLNLWPVHDPVATVVMQSSLLNIDSVMVAGEWRKRNGRLLYQGIERLKDELERSASRILAEAGLRPDPPAKRQHTPA